MHLFQVKMKMKYLYLLIINVLVISCDIKKSNISPDNNFTRVYTDNNSSHTYYPVDVVETDDNGFLIVSGLYDSDSLNYPKVHLLKHPFFNFS